MIQQYKRICRILTFQKFYAKIEIFISCDLCSETFVTSGWKIRGELKGKYFGGWTLGFKNGLNSRQNFNLPSQVIFEIPENLKIFWGELFVILDQVSEFLDSRTFDFPSKLSLMTWSLDNSYLSLKLLNIRHIWRIHLGS